MPLHLILCIGIIYMFPKHLSNEGDTVLAVHFTRIGVLVILHHQHVGTLQL